MANNILTLLKRYWRQSVIEPFMREMINDYPHVPGPPIGQNIWAVKIEDKLAEDHMQEAGGEWNANEDKPNIEGYDLKLYDQQKEVSLNYNDMAFFERNNMLPIVTRDIVSILADGFNDRLFAGPRAGDAFKKGTQYNWLLATNASTPTPEFPSFTYDDASIGDWGPAGSGDPNAQDDAATICGALEAKHYDIANSILYYPECVSQAFRAPPSIGPSLTGAMSIRNYFEAQGIYKMQPVKDSYLLTSDGSLPTITKFDIILVDRSEIEIAIQTAMDMEVVPIPQKKKYTTLTQMVWAPNIIPKKFDTDGIWYKGIARIKDCAWSPAASP